MSSIDKMKKKAIGNDQEPSRDDELYTPEWNGNRYECFFEFELHFQEEIGIVRKKAADNNAHQEYASLDQGLEWSGNQPCQKVHLDMFIVSCSQTTSYNGNPEDQDPIDICGPGRGIQ